MKRNKALAIILAAGKGSRLKSDMAKPMLEVMGKPMIEHIMDTIELLEDIDSLIVVGHKKESIMNHIGQRAEYVFQEKMLGTGHAVLRCRDQIKDYKNIFIFMGDAPFLDSEDIQKMLRVHTEKNSDCTFLYSSFPFELPYARLIFDESERLRYLVEHCNASESERAVDKLFTSHYLFSSSVLCSCLDELTKDITTDEINLTDTINILISKKLTLSPIYIKEYEKLMGINSLEDFEKIENYGK